MQRCVGARRVPAGVAMIEESTMEPGMLLHGPQSVRVIISYVPNATIVTACAWLLPMLARLEPVIRHDRSAWLANQCDSICTDRG